MAVVIDALVLNALDENIYFIRKEGSKECVIADPGWESTKITDYLKKHNLEPVGVILTHGHFDHIHGVNMLKDKGIPVYASIKEKELLFDSRLNLSRNMKLSVTADHYVDDGDEICLAGISFKVIATPGHTEGSICYYIEDEKMLISGDTLFLESYGRTDFPGGNTERLVESFKDVLFKLPDDVVCYPGHGPKTTIVHEKEYNPIRFEF